jgi:hypothetical protein
VGNALVQEVTARAATIDAKRLPYRWGGGHAGKVDPAKAGRWTARARCRRCWGSTRGCRGLQELRVGGACAGREGHHDLRERRHVLMEINGHFFGTSASNPGGGAGWIPRSAISSEYLKNFTARHLARSA